MCKKMENPKNQKSRVVWAILEKYIQSSKFDLQFYTLCINGTAKFQIGHSLQLLHNVPLTA